MLSVVVAIVVAKVKILKLCFFSIWKRVSKFYLFPERGECTKKKKIGHEIGKAAAEKSRGLFR